MKVDQYDGLTVTLQVNGIDLPELSDSSDKNYHPQAATRYVEVTPGTTFAVNVVTSPAFQTAIPTVGDEVGIMISLDGEYVPGGVAAPPFNGRVPGVLQGTAETGVFRCFQFSEMEIVESSSEGLDDSSTLRRYAHMGEIKVLCIWLRNVRESTIARPVPEARPKEAVCEKDLKGRAISSRTTLGPPEKFHARWYMPDYPYGKQSFATFIFKYRTHEDLRKEGIIPRSPSPAPLEEQELDALSPEEARQVIRRLQDRISTESRVKKEHREQERDARRQQNLQGQSKRKRPVSISSDDTDLPVLCSGTRRERQRSSNKDSGAEVVELSD